MVKTISRSILRSARVSAFVTKAGSLFQRSVFCSLLNRPGGGLGVGRKVFWSEDSQITTARPCGSIVAEKLINPRNRWHSTNTTALSYHQRPYVGKWSRVSLLENVILSCLVTRIKPVNVSTDILLNPSNYICHFITAFCRLRQDGPCTYNVTLRRVCATIVTVKKQ